MKDDAAKAAVWIALFVCLLLAGMTVLIVRACEHGSTNGRAVEIARAHACEHDPSPGVCLQLLKH